MLQFIMDLVLSIKKIITQLKTEKSNFTYRLPYTGNL